MNDSTYTTSASGKTNPTKAVLRALTWAAEASISGSGDYHCASFLCFPPCFLVSPQLHRFTVLPSWKEGNVHALCKVSHQLACSSRCRLAAVLHVLYARGSAKHPWSHALCSSVVLSASFHLSLCNACPTSTCNAKSSLFYPTLDLISLAAVKGWLSKADSRSVVTHQTSGRTRNA